METETEGIWMVKHLDGYLGTKHKFVPLNEVDEHEQQGWFVPGGFQMY